MKKHTILFLAANPGGTYRLALDREARAIQVELERSGSRFEFVTRWAAEPLDLLRELRKLKPTVVHFSGHGGGQVATATEDAPGGEPRRDIAGVPGPDSGEQRHGLFFQGPDGRPQLVSTEALKQTFGAVGAPVKLVVLNACYSEVQARALLAHVDCVVGMGGAIHDDAARNFALGFYGGLGERESVAVAFEQGRAAISLEGLPDGDRPRLKIRPGVDASRLVLGANRRRAALAVTILAMIAVIPVAYLALSSRGPNVFEVVVTVGGLEDERACDRGDVTLGVDGSGPPVELRQGEARFHGVRRSLEGSQVVVLLRCPGRGESRTIMTLSPRVKIFAPSVRPHDPGREDPPRSPSDAAVDAPEVVKDSPDGGGKTRAGSARPAAPDAGLLWFVCRSTMAVSGMIRRTEISAHSREEADKKCQRGCEAGGDTKCHIVDKGSDR